MEESSGKCKADLSMLQSDQKITAEKILVFDEKLQQMGGESKLSNEISVTIEDIQSTLDTMKDVQRKHQVKIDDLMAMELNKLNTSGP